ncbi:Rho termination factor N-terminal domain-containing protein [Clostridium sp.]|uniref:Rho termination factor N-terminal domain-containing protein n=1 Tax=Clostridium sp. TaxID=1506 RepID=UPI003217B715
MGLASFNRMRRQQEELKKNPNYEEMTVKELKDKCEELNLQDYKNLKKEELISLIEGVTKHD